MNQACDIRRCLYGESDEMFSGDYAPLLERMEDEANTLTLTEPLRPDGEEETEAQEVLIFRELIDDDELNKLYSEGSVFFNKGSMSHALRIYSRLRHRLLEADAPIAAIAWVMRSMAFANELMKTKESHLIAMNQYKEALQMAIEADNPIVLENVGHDYAEFLWNQNRFDAAIRIYTYQMIGAFRQEGITTGSVMRAIGNMGAAMLKTEAPDLDFVVNCGSMVVILGGMVENDEYMEWGEQMVTEALSMLEVTEDDFDFHPVEIVSGMVDYFADSKLYEPAGIVAHLLDYFPESENSFHDSFLLALINSQINTCQNPGISISWALKALELSTRQPDDIQEKDYDRLYGHLGILYMTYCQYHVAADILHKIAISPIEAVENELICAFVNSDRSRAVELMDSISGDEDLFSPECLELGRMTGGEQGDLEILRENLDKDNPPEALILLLALQRGGAEVEAHEIFMHLVDKVHGEDIYGEMQRLYAIITYLRETNLNEEAEIYRKEALGRLGSFPDIDRQIFTDTFSNL